MRWPRSQAPRRPTTASWLVLGRRRNYFYVPLHPPPQLVHCCRFMRRQCYQQPLAARDEPANKTKTFEHRVRQNSRQFQDLCVPHGVDRNPLAGDTHREGPTHSKTGQTSWDQELCIKGPNKKLTARLRTLITQWFIGNSVFP